MLEILSFVTAGLYLFSSISYLLHLIFAERKTGRIGQVLLTLGVAGHTVLLILHLGRNGYPYILGQGDFYLCTSWGVVGLFLILRRMVRLSASGALFAPLTLLLFLFSLFHRGGASFPVALPHNPWMLVHLLCMSLAFAVFTVSFLVGLTYLFAEKQLKKRKLGRWMAWLPSLETMDSVHYKALTIGFVLLSVGILAGAALSKASFGNFFSGDRRQIAAIGTWAMYAVFLNIRLKTGWRGRKGILLSILGFLGVVLAFLALEHQTGMRG